MPKKPDDDAAALAEYENRLEGPAGNRPADADAAAERLEAASGMVPADDASAPDDTEPDARKPSKRRGKKRGKYKRRSVAKPPAESSPSPSGKSYRTRADFEAEIARLEALVDDLEHRKAPPTPEELADIRETLEGLLIGAQFALTAVWGRAALLTDEQSATLVRIWTRPFRRLQRWLGEQVGAEGEPLPPWVSAALEVLFTSAATVAIFWPNWKRYRDGLPLDADGQPIATRPERSGARDFPRPRGAE